MFPVFAVVLCGGHDAEPTEPSSEARWRMLDVARTVLGTGCSVMNSTVLGEQLDCLEGVEVPFILLGSGSHLVPKARLTDVHDASALGDVSSIRRSAGRWTGGIWG
mmetsp:Transcript_43580/g.98324  ORF Transcript_43580/g.98324 Transcript_43580/m.98324 type:complete len:106 (-) Transcript_43580:177-494(-)